MTSPSLPDARGRFGAYGGRFVPETLVPACQELEAAFADAWADPAFREELDHVLRTYAGRPSILIPLPTATDDHQRRNAETLMAAGAADLLLQRDLTGAVLAQRIVALAADRTRRERMSAAARRLSRPDAARVIVDRAMELMGRRC